jgi:hypothetical protein
MSNFIVLTCAWIQTGRESEHVNSRDASTLHAQNRNKNAHANINASMVSRTVVIQIG